MPINRSLRSDNAVIIITGTAAVFGSRFNCRHTVNPSIFGIITSSKTTSGTRAAADSSAEKPSSASFTS
jgi:hypothetical protein